MPGLKYFITTIVPNGFTVTDRKTQLRLSVCLDIDLQILAARDDEQKDPTLYAKRFADFYISFEAALDTFSPDNLEKNCKYNGDAVPARSISGFPSGVKNDPAKLASTRALLLKELFSASTINTQGQTTRKPVSQIVRMRGHRKLSGFKSMHNQLDNLNGGKTADPNKLTKFLRNATKLSNARKKGTSASNDQFHARVHTLLGAKSALNPLVSHIGAGGNVAAAAEALLTGRDANLVTYLTDYLDPEEFINTYTMINKNIELKRIMGFVLDLQVELPGIPAVFETAPLQFYVTIGDDQWTNIISPITVVAPAQTPAKYAFLPSAPSPHFTKSVLSAREQMPDTDDQGNAITVDCIELLSFDKVAQDDKIKGQKDKQAQGITVNDAEKTDSFTRGIIVNHRLLNQIIEGKDFGRDLNTLAIVVPQTLEEDQVVHGHRVAVLTEKDNSLFSLTKRSVQIFLEGEDQPIFNDASLEGAIHFDAVIHKTDDNAATEYHSSDCMFEWSGQQLTLKSAFSRSSKKSKLDKAYNDTQNPDEDDIKKSQLKCTPHLFVDTYPFNKNPPKSSVRVKYGLPQGKDHKAAQLVFGETYQFAVYHEYKNGWSLPVQPIDDNPEQLSIADLIGGPDKDSFLTKPVTFLPLENKKPPLLFLRKPIVEDKNLQNNSLDNKESLDHLVIRSDNADTPKPPIAERHVLPARISLEHAFWYDLLNQMPPVETLSWKRKYNCSFANQQAYDDFINAKDENGVSKNNKCGEGCKGFCGNTLMQSYYAEPIISPNHLSDPSINGFGLTLYWDKNYQQAITALPKGTVFKFGGKPGIKPFSYRLHVYGDADGFSIFDRGVDILAEISIKKGATVYAELKNDIFTEHNSHIKHSWWHQNNNKYSFHQPAKFDADKAKNLPKQIVITHAVKEPLIVPGIRSLACTPANPKAYLHILDWLSGPYSLYYKIGVNIIACRVNKDATVTTPPIGSTLTAVKFSALFERLDATEKGLGSPFLDGVTPTGGLELWMRKEEYVDDPTQIVHDATQYNSTIQHAPDQPVQPFTSRDNKFSLEYKIDLNANTLEQLKKAGNYQILGKNKDLFKDILSTLSLQFDLKSTKFEEREYYLKDISKFKGFFTTDPLTTSVKNGSSLQQLEEYTLPKQTEVMRDLSNPSGLRFKVMVLNNKKPDPPQIAYVVTTIREIRTYTDRHHTTSQQRGNILTVYLKRGRLSSGKDERVGVLLDGDGPYVAVFKQNDWVSKAGSDIISDRNTTGVQRLAPKNIVIRDRYYDPGFDNELGIYHYLPKFDIEKQLWKFEIELNVQSADGKELHNPFINLCLLHYQPFSLNYNDPTAKTPNHRLDCRISDADNSAWCYLLPLRGMTVNFSKPVWIFEKWGRVDLTVCFNYDSLHFFDDGNGGIIRDNFIVQIEGSLDGIVWEKVSSYIDDGADEKPAFQHALLTPGMVIDTNTDHAEIKLKFARQGQKEKYRHFRVRLVEVEWFIDLDWKGLLEKNLDLLTTDIVDNKNLRVRFVELIY